MVLKLVAGEPYLGNKPSSVLPFTTQRPVPGTRRTRATASLRRPVPAPGAVIALRLVAAAGVAEE